ncbi:hypothetical protein [uncultured Prevotella sp.]|uniref:hypothetical protein n=1 Tax=Leyella stercorea TaxID=363265 RepID=UPI00266B759D|nr:hypothetical protein [uncultured Prevotella sp.]MCF2580274.1 hypothetical protein [Leyella stercorea]
MVNTTAYHLCNITPRQGMDGTKANATKGTKRVSIVAATPAATMTISCHYRQGGTECVL